MTIESGSTKATVHKRLIGIRDHYIIEVEGGEDLKAHGNFGEVLAQQPVGVLVPAALPWAVRVAEVDL